MPDFRQRLQAHMRTDRREAMKAEVPNVKGDATTAVIRLYDPIDSWGEWWGVSAKEFAEAIDALPDTITEIRLLINSPGGEVFEGIAVANTLRNHPARIVAVVEGLAASAASFIAAAADELVMSPNSELMIHDAWGLCVGNADDMTKMAADLDRLCANIASIYQAKAGGSIEDWRALMATETWFSAAEAVESGLADSILATDEGDAQPLNRFDLSIFNFAGRANAPGPKNPVSDPAGGLPTPPPQGGSAVAFSDEQLTDLRQKLDVAEDADEATILAALDGLIEQVTAPPTTTDAPPALPDGVVAIDSAQLDQLRADAEAGRQARDEQMSAHRAHLVNAAVADGRIPPARKDHWLAQLEADSGAEQVLASLKPGLVPVNQIGDGGTVDLDADDAMYAQLYGQEASA